MSVCGCGSQGVLTTLAVMDSAAEGDPDVTFDDTAERYDFIYENIGLNSTVVGDQGLAGSLDLRAEHIRTGPAYVSGSLMMNISPQELEAWLPRILRGAKTGDVHAPGALKPAIDIMIKRDQVTFIYRGLQVDKALFRANTAINQAEPGLVQMLLTFVGVDEEKGTWPDPEPARLTEDVLFWLAADSTLTLASVEYAMEAFNFQIDNMLEPLMRNTLRPTCIRSNGRRVRFQPRLTLCEDNADDLYFTPLDGTGSLSFLSSKYLGNSDSSTIFTFGRLYARPITPETRGRTETFLDLDLGTYPGVDAVANPVVAITNTYP